MQRHTFLLYNLFFLFYASAGYAMEGVTLRVGFNRAAEDAPLADMCKQVQCQVQFDPTKFNEIVDVKDGELIKQEATQILVEAIDLMGNVQLAPFKLLYGAKAALATKAERVALGRKCIALAVMYGAPVDTESNHVTALRPAVQFSDAELALLLMQHDANPNTGALPVYFLSHDIGIAALLHHKLDYAARGPDGGTVLHHMMRAEYLPRMAAWYCLKNATLVSSQDGQGLTPLKRLLLETAQGDYDVESAKSKIYLLLTNIKDLEVKRAYALDALIFAKFRSRADQPGKEHRQILETYCAQMQ